ncbi:ACR261Cp [Eremothecium gossypii ATCC 10895]|uniref:ACR261Cp n=1 Tax=Eremothecium gossypii (strain ATCC 10895 / CBS 109.51 / FGSC 9923 / NRRL Y-1056) TaxID=284811 RepID=Q75BL0_EREGS|nr:ACR261Cp [Eremothecium gossypii ATCC 10895]AAS51487.1 ACR261Cp [Eremothecium gossypii ATCC 10895]AEY95779.1 FACR261Cp [Eremothecium gossypii FDAG1]
MSAACLASWVVTACIVASVCSVVLSAHTMWSQLINYRKPQQQRLVLRIQLMVPIFSLTCFIAVVKPDIAMVLIDPVREIYESFVIYTFFSLLTLLLGGERNILVNLAPEQKRIQHPIPVVGRWVLPMVDMADPKAFLAVKRGILQYVWFKPVYCLGMSAFQVLEWDLGCKWLTLVYNASASWSLYNLALFWKCLYNELRKYNPWPKFLCVKLIIFASYWQGMVITLLHYLNVIQDCEGTNMGYVYHNVALCLEMVAFALAHRWAFSWTEYSAQNIPLGARMHFWYAVRDWLGWKDLIWDFRTTFIGSDYTYRNFDAANTNPEGRIKRINDGLRYTNCGAERHWINDKQPRYGSMDEDSWVDLASELPIYVPEDQNYPVVWDARSYRYTRGIRQLRENIIRERTSSAV